MRENAGMSSENYVRIIKAEDLRPGDGSPGCKGHYLVEGYMYGDKKSCVYLEGARTANRHR